MVLRRVLLRLVVVFGLLAVVCLVLWTSVLRIYRVDSGSMEPFLFGSEESGEAVLVLFDRSVPDRFEPVILRMPEGAVVKRAVGLPGESVKVRYGDVFIDGAKLGAEVARPAFPVIFDQEHHAVEDHFILGATDSTPWRNESASAADSKVGKENGIGGSTWELDALDIEPGDPEGALIFRRNVSDDYTDASHRVVLGARTVNDLALECRVRFLEFGEGAELRLTLREWGEDFVLIVEPGPQGSPGSEPRGRMRLFRQPVQESEAPRLLTRTAVDVPLDRWIDLRFENVDDHLLARFTAEGADPVELLGSYEVGRFADNDEQRRGTTFPPRAQISGARARLQLRDLRLERDLFYTPRDRYGVTEEVQLGVDQIFVLGDNSARSRDSRQFGPVSMNEVVGRPIRVVWPPSAWRSLRD